MITVRTYIRDKELVTVDISTLFKNQFIDLGLYDKCTAYNKYREWFYEQVNETEFMNHVDKSSYHDLNETEFALVQLFNVAKERDLELVCPCGKEKCHGDIIQNFLENKLEEYMK